MQDKAILGSGKLVSASIGTFFHGKESVPPKQYTKKPSETNFNPVEQNPMAATQLSFKQWNVINQAAKEESLKPQNLKERCQLSKVGKSSMSNLLSNSKSNRNLHGMQPSKKNLRGDKIIEDQEGEMLEKDTNKKQGIAKILKCTSKEITGILNTYSKKSGDRAVKQKCGLKPSRRPADDRLETILEKKPKDENSLKPWREHKQPLHFLDDVDSSMKPDHIGRTRSIRCEGQSVEGPVESMHSTQE